MVAPITSRPNIDHLPEGVVAALHNALLEELALLETQAHDLQVSLDELTDHSDRSSVFERELAERSRERALEQIAEIHNAFTRMDLGTYGRCEHCDGPIARPRLEAIPFTRHCVTCPPLPSIAV
jgi:RNA polymerase-binding transcription factor DksA